MASAVEYYDGKSASARSCHIRLGADGIVMEADGLSEFWAYEDIRTAGSVASDPPVTLRNPALAGGAARLIITDAALIKMLAERCADLTGGTEIRRDRNRAIIASLGALAGFAVIILVIVQLLPGWVAPLVPVSWEERLGRQISDDIGGFASQIFEGSGKKCDAPAGQAALTAMERRLTSVIDSPFTFRIKVIDIDEVNALAAPGGFIVIFRKLLDDASGPDEVAGVLAHEMGHVIARHAMESVARDMGVSLLMEFALGGFGGGIAGAAGQALLSTAYSRDVEREADRISLDILARAKISSKELTTFFARLAREYGDEEKHFAIISTHPISAERARAVARPDPADVRPSLSAAEWASLKKICG